MECIIPSLPMPQSSPAVSLQDTPTCSILHGISTSSIQSFKPLLKDLKWLQRHVMWNDWGREAWETWASTYQIPHWCSCTTIKLKHGQCFFSLHRKKKKAVSTFAKFFSKGLEKIENHGSVLKVQSKPIHDWIAIPS